MPDQLVELDDDGALLTRVGGGWTVPVIRYRLGDRLAAARCRCGRGDGLRVVGRADDAIKVFGTLVGIGEVRTLVGDLPGVSEVQLALTPGQDGDRDVKQLVVRFTGSADPEHVLDTLQRQYYDLGVVSHHYPGSIHAVRVTALERVDRTNKVPPAIWVRESAD